MQKVLIMQTAFVGDVILATSLIEQAKLKYPDSEIHFLLRAGNEGLLENNPHIHKLWIWNKKGGKYKNLFKLARQLRNHQFSLVLNIQRFFSSGLLMILLKADMKVGFDKNPLSFLFNKKIKHMIPHCLDDGSYYHEVQRNLQLLTSDIPRDAKTLKPSLYFNDEIELKVKKYKNSDYLVIAPSSVWFTKQWGVEKWQELVAKLEKDVKIFLIGAPNDDKFCNEIKGSYHSIEVLCGKLSLLESACLMRDAKHVIVNDSAPLHLASAVNASVLALFCSTITDFGYFPLSDNAMVFEVNNLDCRPCGLHGKKICPKGHFKCSSEISADFLVSYINQCYV